MVQIYYSNLNNTKEAKEKRFKDEQKCCHENTQAASDLALQCTEDECKLLNSTELGNHQRYIIVKHSQSSTGQKTPLTRSLPKLDLHHSREYSSRRGSILYV